MTASGDGTRQPATRPIDATFGARVRREREQQGMSQEFLAGALAVFGVDWHQTTAGRVESGARPARLAEAVAVAAVLGVPLSELIGERDAVRQRERLERAAAELIHVRQEVDQRLARLREEINSGLDQPAT